MWAYAPRVFEPLKAVVYDFTEGRAGEHAHHFLGDWQGSLICDDYAGFKACFTQGVTEIERQTKDLSNEDRRQVRQPQAIPLAQALHAWMLAQRARAS